MGLCAFKSQMEHASSPGSENVLAGQSLQSFTDCEAGTIEKNPAPHGEHCVLFNSELNDPERHA